MKILVIHGSMRKGVTYALTKEIISRLSPRPGVAVTEISAADLNLPFCRSCHMCFSKGKDSCPHYGAASAVKEALLGCDGVIVGGTT